METEKQVLDIGKMLTISMEHITIETYEWLSNYEMKVSSLVIYEKSEYGWFIFIGSFEENNNLPNDFSNIIKFAKEHDCDWLCIDRDGPEVDKLEKYEW